MVDADPGRFRRDLEDLIGAWHYTGRQSIAATFLSVLRLGANYKMAFPSAMALLGKALITVESVSYVLYPGFDIDKEFRPFIFEVMKHWLSPARIANSVESDLLDYAYAVEEIPKRYSQILDRLAGGEISIKLDRQELEDLREEIRYTTTTRILAPLAFLFILAGTIILHAQGVIRIAGIPVWLLWFAGAGIVGIWLLVAMLRR